MTIRDLIDVFTREVFLDIESLTPRSTIYSGTFCEIEETNVKLLDVNVVSVDQTCSGTLVVFVDKPIEPIEQKYYITMKIDGRFIAEVSAASVEDAKKKANYAFEDANFGDLTDIDGELIMIEDDNGIFVYEK